MPINRRLRRRWMIQSLSRIARKYKNLTYPRFVIKAESEINPERLNDPDVNFSRIESVMGWVAPIPLNLRPSEIRVYVDSMDRPDLYTLRYCDRARLEWNEDPAYYPLFIYRIHVDAIEETQATKTRPRQEVPVVYHYLRTMRGRDEVRQVDGHIANTIEGLEDRRASIQAAENIREVERVRQRVLDEIEAR